MKVFLCIIIAALLSSGIMSASASAETIRLGMVIATTGALAGGEASLINGTKLAVEELNSKGGIKGNQIELIIEDTGSEQTGAINAFNRIVSQEPVAIVNTTVSPFVLSQISMIEDEGIPTLTGASNIRLSPKHEGVPSLFRIRTNDLTVASGATRFAVEKLGARRVAIMRVNSEYGNGWLEAIKETLSNLGQEAVAIESFETTDRDTTPQLLRVKAVNPDVLIVAGNPPNHAVIVQQIKQLGLTMPVVLSNAAVLPTTMKLYQPGVANGMYSVVDSLPGLVEANKEWTERYRKAFKLDPDASAAEYYDGVMMLAAAIEKVGTDKDAIIAELRTIRDRQGVGNVYTFADEGDGGVSVAIVQIENDQLKIVTVLH